MAVFFSNLFFFISKRECIILPYVSTYLTFPYCPRAEDMAIFEDLRLRGQGLQNVSSRTSSRTPPLVSKHFIQNLGKKSMGVGAQDDLGGAPKFCPKNDLKVAWQINRFFCPTWGDLQKKKKKKGGLHSPWEGFSIQRWEYFTRQTCPNDMKLPKILMQYCPKNMKLPEILMQNRPKYMKLPKILPEIWTPYTNRGGSAPPAPHLLRLWRRGYFVICRTFVRRRRCLVCHTVGDCKMCKLLRWSFSSRIHPRYIELHRPI